jgi:hypothetical protein
MADVEIREISPDVASVILLKVDPFTPPDGITRPSSEDRLSLILTKRSGRWLIVHGHNTVIDQGAQRFDPVKTGLGSASSARRRIEPRPSRMVSQRTFSSRLSSLSQT